MQLEKLNNTDEIPIIKESLFQTAETGFVYT